MVCADYVQNSDGRFAVISDTNLLAHEVLIKNFAPQRNCGAENRRCVRAKTLFHSSFRKARTAWTIYHLGMSETAAIPTAR